MHSKIINKIKSNDLKVNLANIIQSCEIIHKDRYLLPFSDHGINHSERMIISLELICKNIYSGTNSLNEYESFILIAAIYLHDIGMQLYRNEVLIDFSKENNLTFDVEDKAEFVRKYHASLSKYWILSNIYNKKSELKQAYFGDSYLGVLIAKVVESHGIDFIDNPEYNDTSYNGLKIRLGLISSLLCLADTLDCDNRRVYIDKLTHSEIPDYSKIHWFKHYYVNSILIINNIVTIYYCFPDISKNDLENYKKYFTYQTEYWINYCETKYEKYFETINLNFKIVSHYETSREKCALSKVNFEYIQEEIVKLYSKKILTDTLPYSISIGILKKTIKFLW